MTLFYTSNKLSFKGLHRSLNGRRLFGWLAAGVCVKRCVKNFYRFVMHCLKRYLINCKCRCIKQKLGFCAALSTVYGVMCPWIYIVFVHVCACVFVLQVYLITIGDGSNLGNKVIQTRYGWHNGPQSSTVAWMSVKGGNSHRLIYLTII